MKSENLNTAQELSDTANDLFKQGDFAGAQPLLERVLAASEKTLGPDHPDTGQALNYLGMALMNQGDLAGAQPLFKRALPVVEKALGPEHPYTAQVRNNLGMVLMNQGDFAKAQPLFERALAVWEKTLGPEDPDTANALNNLGMVLMGQGQFAKAQPLFERALVAWEKSPGPEHTETAKVLNNLGMALLSQGDLARAQPLLERALAINEKTLGPDHPFTAQTLYNVATALMHRDDPGEAMPLFERALAILDKSLGTDHPITAMMRDQLATLLDGQSGGGAQTPDESSRFYKDPPSPLEFAEVSGKEAEDIIKAAAPLIEPAVYPAGKTQVAKAALPFYEGVDFCRLADATLPPPNARFVYYSNGGAVPHDWTNEVIYSMNTQLPLILNEDTITPYVRFFFHYVRGQLGRFELTESIDTISWLPDAAEEAKAEVKAKLMPVSYRGMDQDGMHVLVATVIFKNALFKTKVLVASEPMDVKDAQSGEMEEFCLGQAKLTDEELLLEDLPVAISPPPGEFA